jgi:hypothetical protein
MGVHHDISRLMSIIHPHSSLTRVFHGKLSTAAVNTAGASCGKPPLSLLSLRHQAAVRGKSSPPTTHDDTEDLADVSLPCVWRKPWRGRGSPDSPLRV